jgi:hypothetical protein
VPSPKFQDHEVGDPVEESVNETVVTDAVPVSGVAENADVTMLFSPENAVAEGGVALHGAPRVTMTIPDPPDPPKLAL